MRALASPASLKGVLSARAAAAALVAGFTRAAVDADELPVADGGEGTADVFGARMRDTYDVHDAFGRPRSAAIHYVRSGLAVVESAEVIPLDPAQLDPLAASSRGLGELIARVANDTELLVCLGGTATLDGGAGLREVLHELPGPTTVLCDTLAPLRDAPRLFGPQKGATPEQVRALEERLAAMPELAPYADLPGAGAAGGLGAALAALGGDLVPGARYVLEWLRFRDRARRADLVVTGEGKVDATTATGKAPGEVAAACREEGVACVVFGGVVEADVEGAEVRELTGRPQRSRDELEELGYELGKRLRSSSRSGGSGW